MFGHLYNHFNKALICIIRIVCFWLWFHCQRKVIQFLFFYTSNLNRICDRRYILNQDNLRIGKMLDYIHNNFSDNLTLANIARVADIGERECLRCFQRTIQRSPIQYLLKYRIMQGADFLLKYPATSISEISSFCGLDSPSNFSKMFKRFYNCTPREYRNLHMMKWIRLRLPRLAQLIREGKVSSSLIKRN